MSGGIKLRSALKTLITSLITDGSASISPQDVRDLTGSMVDSAALPDETEIRVINMTTTAPPGAPSDRDAYVVAASASGDWAGHENDIAIWDDQISPAAWVFVTPVDGMGVWNLDDGRQYRYTGANWVPTGSRAGGTTQTGTSYTLALGDANGIVEMNNAGANAVTIPANASVPFPLWTVITVTRLGAGITTVSAAAGVSLNGVLAGSADISGQLDGISLYKRGTDAWVIQGAHDGVA